MLADPVARAIAGALSRPLHGSAVVVPPPSSEPGTWAGAPSAVLVDGVIWLAYRLRMPLGAGRGYTNVVARSDDGLTFEPVATIERDAFGAASLERPTLARTADGRWRLYVSCATPDSFHWRVDMLEAYDPAGLASATPVGVLPGSARWAVKDPVVVRNGAWHLWASCHPLDDPHNTDRMVTAHAVSQDGVAWTWSGTVLTGRPDRWDARGVRISAVLTGGAHPVAFYDGRATAAQNWEERTGVAVARNGLDSGFHQLGDDPLALSPYAGGGLRYLSVVRLPGGDHRLYFELTRPDGAHELRTLLVTAAA